MKKMVAGLSALMLLAGCGGGPAAAPTVTATAVTTVTATATSTVTATPAAQARKLGKEGGVIVTPVVEDLADLLQQIQAAGLVCSGWEPVNEMAGNCADGTMLNAFPDSEAGRTAHRAAVALAWTAISTQSRDDVALLVGPNWFVRADVNGAYALQELFGGAVVGLA